MPASRPKVASTRSVFSRSTTGQGFYLGLAYDHWVAGGDSIVGLLRGLVASLLAGSGQTASARGERAALRPTYARLLRRQFLPAQSAMGLAPAGRQLSPCVPAAIRRAAGWLQRSRASRGSSAADRARLDACASAWGITSHDLLLAIAAQGTVAAHDATTAIADAQRDRGRVDREYSSRPRGGSQRRACPVSGLVSRVAPGARRHAAARSRQRRSTAQTERDQAAQALPADAARHGHRGLRMALHVDACSASASIAKHYPVCAGTTPLSVDPLWTGGAGRAPRAGLSSRRFHRTARSDGPGLYHGRGRDQRRHHLPHDGIPPRCRGRYRCCYASIHQDALTMNRPVSLDLRGLALTLAMCAVLASGRLRHAAAR